MALTLSLFDHVRVRIYLLESMAHRDALKYALRLSCLCVSDARIFAAQKAGQERATFWKWASTGGCEHNKVACLMRTGPSTHLAK